MGLCQFVASLVYIPSSRTARSTLRNLVFGNQTKTKNIYLQCFMECNLPLVVSHWHSESGRFEYGVHPSGPAWAQHAWAPGMRFPEFSSVRLTQHQALLWLLGSVLKSTDRLPTTHTEVHRSNSVWGIPCPFLASTSTCYSTPVYT